MPRYKTLLEIDGWSFMSEDRDMSVKKEYVFIAHMTCPNGVEIEVPRDGRPSVMHYSKYMCQRCNQNPPDSLFGTYALYVWGTGAGV